MGKFKFSVKTQLFAFLFILFFSANIFAITAEEKKDIQDAYYNWCNAIGSAKGNADEVTKFYAPNALLLPTISKKILKNAEGGGMKEYFTKLTSIPDIQCKPEKLITKLHGKVATNSGLYDFIYKDKDGKEVTIPARFTFIYKNVDNHWLIVKHHSSALPE